MSFADKTITCRDCGMDFVFTAGEQEFYASKGFVNEPDAGKKLAESFTVRPAQRHAHELLSGRVTTAPRLRFAL